MLFATLATTRVALGQGIAGTPHDLSQQLGTGAICLPCHAPHNTDTSPGSAPLWNHKVTTADFTVYPTMQGRTGDPNGPSRMCLSCHDGVTALDAYGGASGSVYMGFGDALIGTDLSDEHPIGLSYPPPDATFYASVATVQAAGLRLPNDGTDDRIECQTCHDPHDMSVGSYLRMDNNDSGLCRTCHLK